MECATSDITTNSQPLYQKFNKYAPTDVYNFAICCKTDKKAVLSQR